MIYKATIDVFIDVEDEAGACDAVAETMRDHLQRYCEDSCIIDWSYNPGFPLPVEATEDEVAGLEVPACRVCGCTNNQACVTDDGPCHWVEPDLCSAPICVIGDRARKIIAAAEADGVDIAGLYVDLIADNIPEASRDEIRTALDLIGVGRRAA